MYGTDLMQRRTRKCCTRKFTTQYSRGSPLVRTSRLGKVYLKSRKLARTASNKYLCIVHILEALLLFIIIITLQHRSIDVLRTL